MKKLAIILPGFLDSKDYAHLVSLDNKLSEQGYDVVRINPTGTWGSGEDVAQFSMTQYLADVDEVINKHKGSKEILLAGHSLGGSIALLYASEHPNVTTAIGIMCSTTYIRDENKEKITNWKRLGYRISKRDLPQDTNSSRNFKISYSFIEDAKKYDVAGEIKNYKGKLLLITGELDDCVVPQQLKDIYEKANEPKELVIMPGIGHDYRYNQTEINKVNQEIINFLKK